MAFNVRDGGGSGPSDPEALLRDLRKKTIPGLLSHQADIIRSYIQSHVDAADVAFQLPTGSGKTLVGLLIGEWRRRTFGERVLYLCPTRQLVNQVVNQATTKYGLDVHAFVGSRRDYDAVARADWRSSESLGVTTYSSLFNTNPFFEDPQVVILDDAHSAENYIADFWSVLIDRTLHAGTFSAVSGLVAPLLPIPDRIRLFAEPRSAQFDDWVEKIPTPAFYSLIPDLVPLLDEHTRGNDLSYGWSLLRDSLFACHVYVSERGILIRPLVPPSSTHRPFGGAKQRLYMSATLGIGGDLERVTGRSPIARIPVPTGWDKQGIGRRFFVFPERSLDEREATGFTMEALKLAGRALYLVPDDRSAARVGSIVKDQLGVPVFAASELEESKTRFVGSQKAIAVVANRYDGIDLVDDECRLLVAHGLPRGTNLQERFLIHKVGAQLLLDDRILTRLVQGFGRCTRSANDYAAAIVMGETLNTYLFSPDRRKFFHPEMQAELEFGLAQAKGVSAKEMLENLGHFLGQDAAWDGAEREIVALRGGLVQKTLPAADELKSTVEDELRYCAAMWSGDFVEALERCRSVLGKLNSTELRGYRALWLYLAGSAAWLAFKAGRLESDEEAKDYFRKAQAAAPVLRWLIGLQTGERRLDEGAADTSPGLLRMIERLEMKLENLGTTHDRRYDALEASILRKLLQDEDGRVFESGHEELGGLLGFEVGNSNDEGAPDPWWIVDESFCLVFEDHAEAKAGTRLSVSKARQAASHPNWIKSKLDLRDDAQIDAVLITPCSSTTKGALPHLEQVRYWRLDEFREWAKNALRSVRELRRSFPGPGNLAWRGRAVAAFQKARIDPEGIRSVVSKSAAEAMTDVSGEDEEQ